MHAGLIFDSPFPATIPHSERQSPAFSAPPPHPTASRRKQPNIGIFEALPIPALLLDDTGTVIEVDEITLGIDRAIACVLIINARVANALK